MKSLAQQYEEQLARATWMLKDYVTHTKHLDLVVVRNDGLPPRVSIIGSSISRAMIDIWRGKGARVYLIDRVTI